jgi:flagellar hook-basal body complex protein FliE
MSLPDFIPPVAPLAAVDNTAIGGAVSATAPATGVQGPGFGQLVTQGLEQVNNTLLASQVGMQRLAAGEVGNLHQVMLRMEESRLAFQLMLQVRNRLLESYQEVMRMQV